MTDTVSIQSVTENDNLICRQINAAVSSMYDWYILTGYGKYFGNNIIIDAYVSDSGYWLAVLRRSKFKTKPVNYH